MAVSVATGVPLEFIYLTIEGHILGGQDILGRFGALPGAHIRMNGRLRGGVRPPSEYIPGQWTCGVCGTEGCWPARTKCSRCAAPRSGAAPSKVPPHGSQRERAYPGQPAAPQPVPMNPVRRAPRRPASKQARSASFPSPGPTPAAPVDPGNAEAIAQTMAALEGMGLPEMLLQQVRSSIPPAPAVKARVVSNDKRLAQLGSKINILEQQSTKLTKHLRRLQEEFLETRT